MPRRRVVALLVLYYKELKDVLSITAERSGFHRDNRDNWKILGWLLSPKTMHRRHGSVSRHCQYVAKA